MQRHTILINYAFSSTTQPTETIFSGNGQTFLVNEDGYYLNNVSGLNLGITNPTNVRVYLNDLANQKIINNFFTYLTGNTNQDEFREIFYSDQKLSNVFNSFYNQSVALGQQTSTYHINQQLTGTSQFSYYYSNFNWDGIAEIKYLTGTTLEINDSTRFVEERIVLETFTLDENYYVPIFLQRNTSQTNRITYELETIYNTIYSTIDDNVDLNLNNNYDNYNY